MNIAMFFYCFHFFVTGSMSEAVSSRAPLHRLWRYRFGVDFYLYYGVIGGHAFKIPTLYSPPQQRKLTVPKIFKEIFETLANRSFVSILPA